MTDSRGRHSRQSGSQFYKDVLLLVGGIVIVGAIVFGGMSLLAGGDDPGASVTTTSVTSAGETTTTTTTTLPSTTSGPASTAATTPSNPTTTTPATTGQSAPATTVREGRTPSEVRVVVLNSTQAVGLAGALTDELSGLGYQTIEAANYTPELADTMIFHADGFAIEAVELAEIVGDGTVEPNPDLAAAQGVDVVVVLGLSYQG